MWNGLKSCVYELVYNTLLKVKSPKVFTDSGKNQIVKSRYNGFSTFWLTILKGIFGFHIMSSFKHKTKEIFGDYRQWLDSNDLLQHHSLSLFHVHKYPL